MTISTRRFGWAIVIACVGLPWHSSAIAQEKTPFPALSDKRVYVAGVPDRYQALEPQIKGLERSSPQTYYVVVVKRSGDGEKAATRYAEELLEHWRTQAARSRRSFETDRAVLIVLDVDNHQIAVRPGAATAKQSNRPRCREGRTRLDPEGVHQRLREE